MPRCWRCPEAWNVVVDGLTSAGAGGRWWRCKAANGIGNMVWNDGGLGQHGVRWQMAVASVRHERREGSMVYTC